VKVEYRQLGKSDLRVSTIGLGCVTFGREIDEAESFRILDYALERGINLLDTADAYGMGASETVIGNWMKLRGARHKVVLTTKVGGQTSQDPADTGCAGRRILRNVELSLKRLQTDYLDLYLVHRWDASVPLAETLQAMDTLVRQGKVRYIGCSNYMAWQLCRSLWLSEREGWARYEAIQNAYNLVRPEMERDLIPMCQELQVGILVYSPLAGGFLTGKYRRDGGVPAGTRFDVVRGYQPIYFNDIRWRVLDGLSAKAEALGVPMGQLALAWTLTQPAITSVLIGARDTTQVQNAFDAQAMGMTPELRAELTALWPLTLSPDAAAG
jgi:aryl-alcohol dehydrogenase-like predicted oxidoreductase